MSQSALMAGIPGRSGLHPFTALPRCRRPDPVGGILALAASGVASAAAAAGLTLLLRRLVGGFAEAPTAASGWLVAAGGIAVTAAVDAACHGSWPRWLVRGGLLTASLAFGSVGGLTSWAPLLVAAIAIVLPPAGRIPRPRRRAPPPLRQPSGPESTSGLASVGLAPPAGPPEGGLDIPASRPGPAPAADLDARPAGFRQRIERYDTQTDGDRVRGRAILAVSTGSRTGFAHVGFCPSFASTPTVEVSSDYDGVEAELLVAEILPWGLRLECRLAEPAEEPLEIPLDFEARVSPQ